MEIDRGLRESAVEPLGVAVLRRRDVGDVEADALAVLRWPAYTGMP